MIKLLMSYFDLFKQGTMADNFRYTKKDRFYLSEGKISSVCMLTANILISRDKPNLTFYFFSF